MNPYLDEDLVVLGEHARRFAQGRVAPGFLERDRIRTTASASGRARWSRFGRASISNCRTSSNS
jgi:hypothetical protein